jgi:SAM-dependent methyltransferase
MKVFSIPKRFRYDGIEIVPLTDIQKKARDSIRQKTLCGEYATEAVHCPLCGGSDCTTIAEKDFYGFPVSTVICKACGMVYSNPRLTQASLDQMYATEYRDLDRVKPSSHEYFELEKVKAQGIAQLIALNLMKDCLDGKLVVEVGCGAGGGLQYFSDAGLSVIGCDLSPTNVNFAKSKGLNVHYGGIDSIIAALGDRAQDVGLVIYEQVFEHLVEPKKELSKLKEWLPANALVYLGVPGFKNIVNQYGSDLLRFLQLPHLCHFELCTLVSLANSEGYSFICGDESARALFSVSGKVVLCQEDGARYATNLLYLAQLERRRKVSDPIRLIRDLPAQIGLRLKEKIYSSSLLSPEIKRVIVNCLKGIYHRFFK